MLEGGMGPGYSDVACLAARSRTRPALDDPFLTFPANDWSPQSGRSRHAWRCRIDSQSRRGTSTQPDCFGIKIQPAAASDSRIRMVVRDDGSSDDKTVSLMAGDEAARIKQAGLKSEDSLFPSRIHDSPHLGTRQYARILESWVEELGLVAFVDRVPRPASRSRPASDVRERQLWRRPRSCRRPGSRTMAPW
jgi:hypothetical protein